MKGVDRERVWLKLLPGIQSILLWSVLLGMGAIAQAQITPDGTLGGERSSVVPRVLGGESIEGGAIRGTNLFHSFSEFNIGNQQSVYFTNPTGIQNILTRVTGNTASNINGILGIDGAANLFLLNPNGIIFGQNARLDVRGSFVGTTANAVGFGNQGDFSATNPQAPSLLTVQPSALLFNQIQGGQIVNRSQSSDRTGLSVPTGKSLLLVGGNILSDGGQITVPGGRIELGGLAEPGTIGLINSSDRWQLTFPTGVQLADITLQNQGSILNTGGLDNIVLTGRNITVIDTPLLPVVVQGVGTSDRRAGDLIVNATGTASFDYSNTPGSPLGNAILEAFGGGSIAAENIFLKRTSLGGTSILSQGVNLTATNTITLDSSQIQAAQNPTTGNITGNVNITARNLNLINGSLILTTLRNSTSAESNSGKISLQVLDTLLLSDSTGIVTSGTAAGGELGGRSGDIEIQARAIVLDGERTIISAFNQGTRAGDVRIKADSITVNGGGINSISTGTANGGNLEIQTRVLSLRNGGKITTASSGSGNSGNLTINASEAIELKGNTSSPFQFSDGSSAFGSSFLSASAFGSGNAGQLVLNTRKLTVQDGGSVTTSTGSNSSGQGGSLTINASELVDVFGEGKDGKSVSLISAATAGTGGAGNLTINTARLRIRDGAFITVGTLRATANAKGGNLTIRAKDAIEIGGRSRNGDSTSSLTSSTRSAGNAGTIVLQTDSLSILDGFISSNTRGSGRGGDIFIDAGSITMTAGAIFAVTRGQGDAGNVTINARGGVVLKGIDQDGFSSSIVADADGGATGKPGSIFLNADSVQLVDNAFISVSTTNDQPGGNITINANRFEAKDGSSILSGTTSNGRAGNLIFNIRDRITLQGADQNQLGSGLYASSGGAGAGGSIVINTQRLEILDKAVIKATSNTSSNAGSITINTSLVRLNNDAEISTRSGSADGGDVTINASNALVLRRNSRISASVGTEQALGDGGNIVINAGAIVAKPNENNTIQANARAGRGGNISIVTRGLFGIAPSNVLIPGQNTITASSELGVQGNVTVNQPSVQPTQGVLELSTEVLDASNQIAQVCPRNSNMAKVGRFIVSGTGSLPPNPIEPLTGSAAIPLATIEGSPTTTIATVSTPNDSEIVEAQGWVKTADGKVTLVAQAAETTPSSRPTANCSTVTQQ